LGVIPDAEGGTLESPLPGQLARRVWREESGDGPRGTAPGSYPTHIANKRAGNLRRCVGPRQVEEGGLRAEVERTGADWLWAISVRSNSAATAVVSVSRRTFPPRKICDEGGKRQAEEAIRAQEVTTGPAVRHSGHSCRGPLESKSVGPRLRGRSSEFGPRRANAVDCQRSS